MYNSKELILDKDLTFLSFNQTINAEFTMSEILDSDLWHVDTANGLVKAVPLFNCDEIVSSNPNDKVLDDNRCVILENSNDTLIQCISEDTGGIHYYNSVLYAYTPYCRLNGLNELVVYCIVYDKYLNTLNNVDVSVYVDDELNTIIKTNNEGLCEFKVDTVCTVKFKYEDTTSNEITIR